MEQEDREQKFDGFSMEATFPNQCWRQRYLVLRESIERLKPLFMLTGKGKNAFASWIDADYWLFGLIYYIVFKGWTLKDNLAGLDKAIAGEVEEKKKGDYYAKAPNRLGNLRERLDRSLTIIGVYVQ